jgi:hypothetical protein
VIHDVNRKGYEGEAGGEGGSARLEVYKLCRMPPVSGGFEMDIALHNLPIQ